MTSDNGFPVVATNRTRTGETVADAVNGMLRNAREGMVEKPTIAVASAYINAAGFKLLAVELEQAGRVRLLLGAEPDRDTDTALNGTAAGDSSRIQGAVASQEIWLRMQRNLLGFSSTANSAAEQFHAWLTRETGDGERVVEVRRFCKGFLHGKCYIAEHRVWSAAIVGSSNLTYAGLSRNAELNLGTSGKPGHVPDVRAWFDELWDDSEPFDLAGVYAALWEPYQPWLVYLRMLYELYGTEPDDSDAISMELGLTGFQRDGVGRALRLMEQHNGVIVCDEVGLGKTYIAGEIIARTQTQRQKVLVIAPASVKRSVWEPFLNKRGYSRWVEVRSHDELRDRMEEDAFVQSLDDYALVVIDEAHNLRNAATQRAAAVNRLVGGKYPKKVLLLTATPVNNSLMDLHTLVSYFIRNDAAFTAAGIPSIRGYIRTAQNMDPESLSPEHLFDLMDQVAVRRTRKFVADHYPGDRITLPDGREQVIVFPEPRPERIDYKLDGTGEELLRAVVYALTVPDNDSLVSCYSDRRDDPDRLLLARYMPSAYHRSNDPDTFQLRGTGLLRSALLKRLESSNAAIRSTLRKMVNAHEKFLEALDSGYVLTTKQLDDYAESDDVDAWVEAWLSDSGEDHAAAEDFDVAKLRADVEADWELLDRLHGLACEAWERSDPKVEVLIGRLRDVAAAARRPTADGLPATDRRKTIIFTGFTDTVVDVHRRVMEAIDGADRDDPISDFKGRVAAPVHAGVRPKERGDILKEFAPETAGDSDRSGRPVNRDRYDLLLTTDVLAEGVNLQQCGRIIHFDLPWNPMRLVQRNGRIDRIGSKHSIIVPACFFPAEHLDELLHLEETLQRKLAYADATIGAGNVLPGAAGKFEVTLQDTREQIQKLWEENPELYVNGGSSSAAQSGEEYRKQLSIVMKDPAMREAVLSLPWPAGSGFVSGTAPRSGFVFCARINGTEKMEPPVDQKPWFRFVPVNPETWEMLPKVDRSGLQVEADTLTCLLTADPGGEGTERDLPDDVYRTAFDAWEAAQEDIYRGWEQLTDPNTFRPELPKQMREAINLIQKHGKETGFSVGELNSLQGRFNSNPPSRVIKEIREVNEDSKMTDAEKVVRLREVADRNGLMAPAPAKPLPEIRREDIHLITWMAVRGRDTGTT